MADDEGVLDPWVEEWFKANPMYANPLDELTPELLALARMPMEAPVMREIARVRDETIDGVPVRFYEHDTTPTGVVVYFHGGGFCLGSVGLMDNVAREIAHATGATVISVEYRLAPEHPFPAGFDDCTAVTRWAVAHATELGAASDRVVVAGESAGGNLAAAVSLRLRDEGDPPLAGQVLIYPTVDTDADAHPSRAQFDGLVISLKAGKAFDDAYSGGRDVANDPYRAPLRAASLAGLPPAIVVLGGCDMLRDEGRAYTRRLRDAGVTVEEVCYAGQPHGFVNFSFPAAAEAHERIGEWTRAVLAAH
jgi:acetyl esterase